MTPFGESRGGTPMGERALQGAEDTDQRLSAFRFPFSSCSYIRGLKH
jgi:hypothetical protein